MTNKLLSRFIVVILLCAFLTCTVGRVTRVSAVGTTVAAVAGAATLAVGIGFLSYCALSGMAIHCPNTVDKVKSWLTDVGDKVIQYPSGRAAYQDMYTQMIKEPATDLLDRVWTWTKDRLLSFANDFPDTRTITDIVGYYETVDVSQVPTNGYSYSFTFVHPAPIVYMNGSRFPLSSWDYAFFTGPTVLLTPTSDGVTTICPSNCPYQVRNVLEPSGLYTFEMYINGEWSRFTNFSVGGTLNPSTYFYPRTTGYDEYYGSSQAYPFSYTGVENVYPVFPNAVIYDRVNDVNLPMVQADDQRFMAPQWTDPDNEYRPIVPFVEIPDDPFWTPPSSGSPFGDDPAWGFPLQDLLDILAELGQLIFDLTVLKELINTFKSGLVGDENNYYIYYDDSQHDYYTYYQVTNYNGDYITYDIDVSDADEHLSVDLNTIQLYTDNRYIDSFKRSAIAGGSIIRDLVVFWYDVDPEIIYVFFGSCILILIAAFIGKWGHS